jgi:hypothetical protein
VLDAERGHALLAQAGGRLGGWIAGQEVQRDRAFDVGEDGLGAWPEGVQAGGELVGGGHPLVDQVGAGAHHGAQGASLRRERLQDPQPVVAQAQVLGDHGGVAGVVLGARQHLGVAPGLDGVGLDRHDRVAGFQQPVDQPTVGAFDRHRQRGRFAEPSQSGHQLVEPIGGVADLEGGGLAAGVVEHAHRVTLRRPVDPAEHVPSSGWQRHLGEEGFVRAVTDWRSAARPSVAGHKPSGSWGRQCHAGPQGATDPGHHPSSHRSHTAKTMPASVKGRVHQ